MKGVTRVTNLDCIQPFGQIGFTSFSRKVFRNISSSWLPFPSVSYFPVFDFKTWPKHSLQGNEIQTSFSKFSFRRS